MSAFFSGIECPRCCSIDLKVLETRRQEKAIVRQRECDRRHRFYTVELVADEDGLPSTTPDDAAPMVEDRLAEMARTFAREVSALSVDQADRKGGEA